MPLGSSIAASWSMGRARPAGRIRLARSMDRDQVAASVAVWSSGSAPYSGSKSSSKRHLFLAIVEGEVCFSPGAAPGQITASAYKAPTKFRTSTCGPATASCTPTGCRNVTPKPSTCPACSARPSTSTREVVRNLVGAVVDAYDGHRPKNDATVLCLDWQGPQTTTSMTI